MRRGARAGGITPSLDLSSASAEKLETGPTVATVLGTPFPLDLTPKLHDSGRVGQPHTRPPYTHYVEPSRVDGASEILRVLRAKLGASRGRDAKSFCYSPLHGSGLALDAGTCSWVEQDVLSDIEPSVHIRYRVITVADFVPIGYCTFTINVRIVDGIEIDIHEVWLAAKYRGIGLGKSLAETVAEKTMHAISVLDGRLFDARPASVTHRLKIGVGAEIHSPSGRQFLKNVISALDFELRFSEWLSLSTESIAEIEL